MKFKIYHDCEYVAGHLRYGHLEGTIEVESREEFDQMIEDNSYLEYLEPVVDDYCIDDYMVSDKPPQIEQVE